MLINDLLHVVFTYLDWKKYIHLCKQYEMPLNLHKYFANYTTKEIPTLEHVVSQKNDNCFDIMKYLFDNMSESCIVNCSWYFMFNNMCHNHYHEIIQYIFSVCNKSFFYKNVNDVINLYAHDDDGMEMVKYLCNLINEKYPQHIDKLTNSSIWCASYRGQLQMVKYLVSVGATYNHYAVHKSCREGGNVELVRFFYELDNNCFDIVDFDFACDAGFLDIVKFIFEHASPELKIEITESTESMHNASFSGHLNVVKYLHKNGAPITKYAIEWACEHGHFEIIKYFHENGASFTEDAINRANKNGHFYIVQYLYENDVPIITKHTINSSQS